MKTMRWWCQFNIVCPHVWPSVWYDVVRLSSDLHYVWARVISPEYSLPFQSPFLHGRLATLTQPCWLTGPWQGASQDVSGQVCVIMGQYTVFVCYTLCMTSPGTWVQMIVKAKHVDVRNHDRLRMSLITCVGTWPYAGENNRSPGISGMFMFHFIVISSM